MKRINTTPKKSDDAISPVIGVILMLAVTIIVAAVVVAVSTGMVTDTQTAPNAALDVKIYRSYEGNPNQFVPDLHLIHVSGDPIPTSDLKLIFSWNCGHGASCPYGTGGEHYSTYEYVKDALITGPAPYPGAICPSILSDICFVLETWGYEGDVQPLYINYGESSGEYFGTRVLEFGDTMMAFSIHHPSPMSTTETYSACQCTNEEGVTELCKTINRGNPAMEYILNNGKVEKTIFEMGVIGVCYGQGDVYGFTNEGILGCLDEGTKVQVTIIHTPSNKPILDKVVYVQ